MSLDPLILKALASAGDGEGLSVQDALLSQLEAKDPTAAMLAKYLTQSHEADNDDLDDDLETENEFGSDNRYHPADVETAFEQQATRLELAEEKLSRIMDIARQMKQKLKATNKELQALQNRNDMLSEAVGACYLCWGENHTCEVCSGRGRPGAFIPIADRYQRYVAPANQRLRQQLAQQRAPNQPVPEFHQHSDFSPPQREGHSF